MKSKPTALVTNMLTRAAIFATDDRKSEIVQVPQWGGAVRVQEMSGTLRDRWEVAVATAQRAGFPTNATAKLVAFSVVDEAGTLLFTESDIDELSKKSGAALTLVANTALRLSYLTSQDLGDAVKN